MNTTYTSKRLIMKILNSKDADSVLAFYREGGMIFDAVENVKPPAFYTIDYQRASLESEYNAFCAGAYARYYIFSKDEPHVIAGTISFSHITRGIYNSCIIGYKLLPRFQGKGYAFESLEVMTRAVFEDMGLHRIEALVLPDNHRSINLLKKLKFECEGTAKSIIRLKNGYADHLRFALVDI